MVTPVLFIFAFSFSPNICSSDRRYSQEIEMKNGLQEVNNSPHV